MPTVRHSPFRNCFLRLCPALAGLLLPLPAAGDGVPALPFPLIPGVAVERPLAAGGRERFDVEVHPDSARLLLVDQLGIDVVVEVRGSASGAFSIHSPQGREGTESVLLSPAAAVERFEIEVRNEERGVAAGRFRLQLLTLRRDSAEDRRRRQAEEAVFQAGRLVRESTAETASRQATALLQQALEQYRTLSDPRREAQIWSLLGAFQVSTENRREAADAYHRALALWRRLDHRPGVASALHRLGVLHLERGDFPQARTALEEALNLRRSLEERPLELETRNHLCLTLQRSGRFPEAATCYRQARELARRLDDGPLLARVLNSLGGLHQNLGEPTAALEAFEEAREMGRALGDAFLEGATLNNLGALHRSLGEVEEALLHYRTALALFEEIDNRTWQARTLNNLGFAYLSLGEFERARATLRRALPLRRAVGDRAGEAVTLLNLGRASTGLAESVAALAFFREALDLNQGLRNSRGVTTARRLLGEVHLERGEPTLARPMLEQVLDAVRDRGQRQQEGEVLELLARTHEAQSRDAVAGLEAARDLALRALALHQEIRDPLGEIRARTTLARLEQRLGRWQTARETLTRALATVERLQGRLGEPDRRAAFLASQRQVYENLMDLLLEFHRRHPRQGYERLALETSEQARSRALLALLAGPRPAFEGSGDPALERRLREARRRFTARTRLRMEILGSPHSPEAAREAEQAAYEALNALEAVRAEGRRSRLLPDPEEEARTLSTAEIQALLDPETVLLEFLVGEESSVLWWVTTDTVTAHSLPPRRIVENLARRVRQQLAAPHRRSAADREALAQLASMLLGPVADRLEHQRLVVVADGALHLVPFAALPRPGSGPAGGSGGEPLLVHHEVVHLPSASVLAAQRRKPRAGRPGASRSRQLAILADPIFQRDDPRLESPGQGTAEGSVRELEPTLARLLHTRLEAEAIAALVPPEQRLLAMGSEARRALVVEGELAQYRLLHFATHGFLHPHAPELSGLVFSRLDAGGGELAGFLGLHDVAHLELSAELVVLSGCETALGKAVEGEGLLGLTRGFLHTGVPRVVASLWQVRDQATARLMERFYRGLLVENLPPAAALRAAQLALRQERRFRDPFYWAAFTIQGDWR